VGFDAERISISKGISGDNDALVWSSLDSQRQDVLQPLADTLADPNHNPTK